VKELNNRLLREIKSQLQTDFDRRNTAYETAVSAWVPAASEVLNTLFETHGFARRRYLVALRRRKVRFRGLQYVMVYRELEPGVPTPAKMSNGEDAVIHLGKNGSVLHNFSHGGRQQRLEEVTPGAQFFQIVLDELPPKKGQYLDFPGWDTADAEPDLPLPPRSAEVLTQQEIIERFPGRFASWLDEHCKRHGVEGVPPMPTFPGRPRSGYSPP